MFDILAVTLLIILALVLAVLEIFFLPGITIAGICSVLFYGGGIYYAYSAFGTNGAVITLFIAAVTTIAVIIGFMRSRSLDKMSLHTEISSVVPSPITPDIKVGDMGVTLSRLNPMGKIIVGIHTIEARAGNELIDEDTPVKIIRIEPTVVIVCKETENEKTLDHQLLKESAEQLWLTGIAILDIEGNIVCEYSTNESLLPEIKECAEKDIIFGPTLAFTIGTF